MVHHGNGVDIIYLDSKDSHHILVSKLVTCQWIHDWLENNIERMIYSGNLERIWREFLNGCSALGPAFIFLLLLLMP